MNYLLRGDLCQLNKQGNLLRKYGVDFIYDDIPPKITTREDLLKFLSLMWLSKTDGWWHYNEEFVKECICTQYDFWSNLNPNKAVKLRHYESRVDIIEGKVILNGELVFEPEIVVHKGDIIKTNNGEYKIK